MKATEAKLLQKSCTSQQIHHPDLPAHLLRTLRRMLSTLKATYLRGLVLLRRWASTSSARWVHIG